MKKKFKTPLIIFVLSIVIILFFLKCGSTEIIPYEDPEVQKKLDKAIAISKFDVNQGITELENLKDLPEYTDYKRNYVLARLFEKKENYNKSISIYDRLINKKFPLKERVIFHLANLKAKEGNDPEALKLYNKLLGTFPYSRSVPQAKYYLAQTQLRLKYIDEAIYTLGSLRSEFPKTQFGIAANYYLGEYTYNKKNYSEALKYWRKYLEESPDGRFANEIGEFFRSGNLSLLPSDYSLLGDVFFHKKDYNKAAYFYRIENNSKKFYELGYSLYRINNKLEAAKYLKEYAYSFPKSDHARHALYYAAICTPYNLRKEFYKRATKDIPTLAYYTIFKEALLEQYPKEREKILLQLLSLYPNSDFTLEAVWEIMWQKIKDRNYEGAEKIAKKYFERNLKSNTTAKIGFWLGKIAEITGQKDNAIKYYEQTKDIISDNYYSLRANDRLLALKGRKDKLWSQEFMPTDFATIDWNIPNIIKLQTIKRLFGATVYELIKLGQFDEAMELIGKSKFPSKRITAWLNALNSEYEASINLANSIILHYNLNQNSLIWELAYPLYFWQHILNTCKSYPGVDPLLICGLIRQESKFDTNAKSPSGAYGLMQLIVPTAKTISRQISLNLPSSDFLSDPKINIVLGIHYLDGLIKDWGNPLFAVASYNAGVRSVKKWVNDFNRKDLDFFIEEIPYDETRNYVKNVFSNYWMYAKLYRHPALNQKLEN